MATTTTAAVANESTERETDTQVEERFCRFLLDYSAASVGDETAREPDARPYVQQLERMVTDEESSTVRVDFFELDAFDGELALAVESEYPLRALRPGGSETSLPRSSGTSNNRRRPAAGPGGSGRREDVLRRVSEFEISSGEAPGFAM